MVVAALLKVLGKERKREGFYKNIGIKKEKTLFKKGNNFFSPFLKKFY